ncbi:MAG: hypothetical protein IJ551_10840 [Prevotella sp.]|nr:hypothetical protein [Prevotella sp.]
MKKVLLTIAVGLTSVAALAQDDAKAFKGYLYNQEYEVYLRIDFYNESVTVPGNELYGQLPGYLGKKNNSFCWPITAAKVQNEQKAELSLINDYGSEDLTATLTRQNDTLYILKQEQGSTLKVPKNGKWQKLPKTLPFTRKR